MQKLINIVALLSGLTSLGLIGGGAYLYINKDDIAHHIHEDIARFATEAITEALPGMLDAAMPEIPDVTGGPLPGVPPTKTTTTTTGPAIPSF